MEVFSLPAFCCVHSQEEQPAASTSEEEEDLSPLQRAKQALAAAPIDQELLVRVGTFLLGRKSPSSIHQQSIHANRTTLLPPDACAGGFARGVRGGDGQAERGRHRRGVPHDNAGGHLANRQGPAAAPERGF